MKDKIIKWLGGYTEHEFDRLYFHFKQQNRMIQETIELCNAHNEWEIVKQRYQQRRVH